MRGPRTRKLLLPAPDGSLLADLENLKLPRGMLNRSVPLGTFNQAVSLAVLLVDSFGPKAMIQGQGPAKGRDFILRQNLPWVLNGYNRLRRVVVRWLQRMEPGLAQSEERVLLQFLASTHRLCVPQSSAPVLLSDMSLTATWIQCLGELIHASISLQSSTLQTVLSDCLNEVLRQLKQSKSSVQPLRETSRSILQELNDQRLILHAIDPRLVVNFALFSTGSSLESTNSMQQSLQSLNDELLHTSLTEIRPPGSPVMPSDTKISTISQRQAVTGQNQKSNEGARAPKRLCLAAAQADQDSLQAFMSDISSMLGSDCAESLVDLRSALE